MIVQTESSSGVMTHPRLSLSAVFKGAYTRAKVNSVIGSQRANYVLGQVKSIGHRVSKRVYLSPQDVFILRQEGV